MAQHKLVGQEAHPRPITSPAATAVNQTPRGPPGAAGCLRTFSFLKKLENTRDRQWRPKSRSTGPPSRKRQSRRFSAGRRQNRCLHSQRNNRVAQACPPVLDRTQSRPLPEPSIVFEAKRARKTQSVAPRFGPFFFAPHHLPL